MKNGQYTFYVIQQRRRAEGEWLKLESPIKPIPEEERHDWSNCSPEFWGCSLNPHTKNYKPSHIAADKEWCECKVATGNCGWWTLKYAIEALKRVRQDDADGMYDSRDTYGKTEQLVRHEFRIVKIQLTYEYISEPLTVEDVVQAV